MLENIAKANEEWKKIIDRQTEENNTLRRENITLQEKYHQQFDINTALRQERDTKNTKIAVLSPALQEAPLHRPRTSIRLRHC